MGRLTATFALLIASAAPYSAAADLFVLHTGGEVAGELLNPDEKPRQSYVVQTANGRITLAAAQVRRVVEISAAERRYKELLPQVADTAAGHWQMSVWCQEQALEEARAFHLEQVLRHDTNHEQARAALGYGRINERWVKADEHMRQLGYVSYKGAWRTPQEVALEEQGRARELAEKGWKQKLRMWRSWIGKRRHDDAVAEFRALKDPAAAVALVELLQEENQPDVKLLFLGALGDLPVAAATLALINVALTDDHDRCREAALDLLKSRADPGVARIFMRYLQDKDNTVVNRAGVALGRLGEKAAILPLIEALSTKHRSTSGGGSGGLGISFNSGAGGLGVGGGPKVVEKEVRNAAVLSALLLLTGGTYNFHYDEGAWKEWYTRERAPQNINLRRDE